MCIYARNKRANCGALITVLPKRNDLIYAKRNRAGKNIFHIDFEKAVHESSYDDWEIVESNEVNHSLYCIDQVSLNERHYSQFITENGTPAEVQEERRKYSRFGQGQPLQRNFRFTHTRKAVETGKLEIKSVAEEQLFHTKGAEFLAKITGIVKEKKAVVIFKQRTEI